MVKNRTEVADIDRSLYANPSGGPGIEGLDMDHIVTYVKPTTDQKNDWESVPDDIKDTFEREAAAQLAAEQTAQPAPAVDPVRAASMNLGAGMVQSLRATLDANGATCGSSDKQ